MSQPQYCVTETPDKMTRAMLYVTACRVRMHVHGPFDGPCRQCLEDMVGLGAYGFVLLNLLNEAEREIEQLRSQLADQPERVDAVPGRPLPRGVEGVSLGRANNGTVSHG